jgi:hypothetical protein
MAHFAKLGINGTVIGVLTVNNSDILNAQGQEDEKIGQEYLERMHGWPASMWIQTSYNTSAGTHRLGGTPFRGNYAGKGMVYDEDNDIFRAKKAPYANWTLNTTTANWEAPTPMPDNGKPHTWNEATQSWDEEVLI